MTFSIKLMIVFVTGLSIYLAMLFAVPSWLGLLCMVLITLLLPAINISGIVYGRGAWKAFWIGCTATAIVTHLVALNFVRMFLLQLASGLPVRLDGYEGEQITIMFAASHCFPILGGLVAVGMARLFEG